MVSQSQADAQIVLSLRDQISGGLKGVGSNLDQVGKKARNMGLVMTAAFGGVAALGTKAASDLAESTNAVNVVFGEASNTIREFGEVSAQSAGLATSDFQQLATQTGALLQQYGLSADEAAQGTVNLTKRAADLASVHNTDVKDALMAVNAAIRGEAEPLRRYAADVTDASVQVFLMSQGIDKQVGSLTQQERGMLRMQVLLSQTNKVQGDFVNTSDQFANSQRIVRAEMENHAATLGQSLLPFMEGVVNSARRATSAFGEWSSENRELASLIGPVVLGLTAVGGALVVIGVGLPPLVTGIKAMTTVMKLLSLQSLRTGASMAAGWVIGLGPIGLIIAAIAGLVAAFFIFRDKIPPVLRFVGRHLDTFKSFFVDYFLGPILEGLASLIGVFNQDWADAIRNVKKSIDDFSFEDQFGRFGDAAKDFGDDAVGAIKSLIPSFDTATASADTLGTGLDTLGSSADGTIPGLSGIGTAADGSASGIDSLTASISGSGGLMDAMAGLSNVMPAGPEGFDPFTGEFGGRVGLTDPRSRADSLISRLRSQNSMSESEKAIAEWQEEMAQQSQDLEEMLSPTEVANAWLDERIWLEYEESALGTPGYWTTRREQYESKETARQAEMQSYLESIKESGARRSELRSDISEALTEFIAFGTDESADLFRLLEQHGPEQARSGLESVLSSGDLLRGGRRWMQDIQSSQDTLVEELADSKGEFAEELGDLTAFRDAAVLEFGDTNPLMAQIQSAIDEVTGKYEMGVERIQAAHDQLEKLSKDYAHLASQRSLAQGPPSLPGLPDFRSRGGGYGSHVDFFGEEGLERIRRKHDAGESLNTTERAIFDDVYGRARSITVQVYNSDGDEVSSNLASGVFDLARVQ